MTNRDNSVTSPDVEKKVTVVDGEQTVVVKLPDGTARMVITKPTEEDTEEE
jgi:hypothetical protein